jgi:hypothetical protein
MNPSERHDASPTAAAAAATLLQCLCRIPDARHARGVRYAQGPLLALCLVAFICGRQNLTQIHRFARDNPELLGPLGFARARVPSVPTLSRVLGSVAPQALQAALSEWLGGLIATARQRAQCRVAAVDGKTSRATGTHLLNVFLHRVQQVLWQAPVGEKANEITAFRASLAQLLDDYPFLRILTGDAMFAGAPLCGELIERGRHYVFQIKADQPSLLEKMELVFSARLARRVDPASVDGEKKGRLRRGARGVDG